MADRARGARGREPDRGVIVSVGLNDLPRVTSGAPAPPRVLLIVSRVRRRRRLVPRHAGTVNSVNGRPPETRLRPRSAVRWVPRARRSALAARGIEGAGPPRRVGEGAGAEYRAPRVVRSPAGSLPRVSPPLHLRASRATRAADGAQAAGAGRSSHPRLLGSRHRAQRCSGTPRRAPTRPPESSATAVRTSAALRTRGRGALALGGTPCAHPATSTRWPDGASSRPATTPPMAGRSTPPIPATRPASCKRPAAESAASDVLA